MGDTKTHAAIGEKVIAVLKEGLPADHYEFFRIGNWLTDMSQLRDPPAHIGAKLPIYEKKRVAGLAEVFASLNLYLDDLMGTPVHDGALARFFRELTFYVGCEKYRKKPDKPDIGVDIDEFKEIFNSNWTQYYPHEHLDFPPWEPPFNPKPSDKPCHTCKSKGQTGGGTRKILNYLEDQITYIGLLLTVIEDQWARLHSTDPLNDKKRHKILALYGHASHAVEDFFFHSNFVEAAWAKIHAADAQNGFTVREKRIFYRRQLLPAKYGKTFHSPNIFTGYFGSEDIFHTLMDAAKGFEDEKQLPGNLLKKMLNANEAEQAKELKEHRLIGLGGYGALADTLVSLNEIHPESAESWKRMWEIDFQLAQKYPMVRNSINKVPLGVFGFVQMLAIMAKEKEDESEKAREALDKKNREKDDDWQDGASVEDVGSHSLMTKDSVRKEPLRKEAVNLATCTALYIARRMIERFKCTLPAGRFDHDATVSSTHGATNTCDTNRIDWIHLLRHCLSHPDESEGATAGAPWWVDALQNENAGTSHNILTINDGEVQNRVQQEAQWKKELQDRYNRLAVSEQTKWKREYRPGSSGF